MFRFKLDYVSLLLWGETFQRSRVKKQKSIYDIRKQVERLQAMASRDTNRVSRIEEIGNRYVRNIASSKRFANDIYKGRGLDVARSRTYSQNTYMGYNNG